MTLLQIFREPLKAGAEAEYTAIEDEIARACIELKCPHPHLAMEPLTGAKEVWWLNAFESEADRERVKRVYADNRALMAALEQGMKRKAPVTGPPIDFVTRYRSDLSGDAAWSVTGARFVVVAVTQWDVNVKASVFEAPDGARYILKPVGTLEEAGAEARRLRYDTRVFSVLPQWGMPATEWIDADPDFWSANPLLTRKQT